MGEKRKPVPAEVAKKLWVKAGGRCEYEGCNKLLYRDSLTEQEMNTSYIAHVVSASVDGPRGHLKRSKELEKDLGNLMLLCDVCHRRIDREQLDEHPEARLLKMKKDHEGRIELVTAITAEKKSHIIIYTAKVGDYEVSVQYKQAAYAMIPERFPASDRPLQLGLSNSMDNDFSESYWNIQLQQLETSFNYFIRPLLGHDPVQDFSVFAFAPQPLLIKLGSLLSDKYPSDVYQYHRSNSSWKWKEEGEAQEFKLIEPSNMSGTPTLVFSLSGTINRRHVQAAVEGCSIWEINIENPYNDHLCLKDMLPSFKKTARKAIDKISQSHGNGPLHIFPAMPVSAAVELGKLRMAKADMPWIIYDYNNKNHQFFKAVTIQ